MTLTTPAVTDNASLPIVAASPSLSPLFAAEAEGLMVQTQAVIHALPSRTEEEVIAIARNARTMERCGYVIRGACARELLSRVAPLQGGRGKKDTQGAGRKAVLTALAAQLGVEARTLADDERIYATFYAPSAEDMGEANLARYEGLGRDHFRAALSAPDPLQAIEAAAEKTQSGRCPVRAFRANVQADKAAGRQSEGLVFEAGDALPTNPLCASGLRSSTAVDAAPARWEYALGEEAVAALQTLTARHNAVYPADLLDAVGYVRRLIMQAVREAGVDLPSTTEVALSTTEEEGSGATFVSPMTASTSEALVLA